ncbi:MAG: VOC family protein [Planctomycetota bacterium]|jgi:predicted enzyme related to lactoylglutathione lyase
MGNPVCHFELMTTDAEAAKEFYGKLFDWKLQTGPEAPGGMPPYTLIDAGTPPMGGIMAKPDPAIPTSWSLYIQVDSLDATVAKVAELGGSVLKEKSEVPGMGWFAVISDPQGGVIGVWEAMRR